MLTARRSNVGEGISRRQKLFHTEADSDQLYPRATISVLPDDVLLEIFVCVARPQEGTIYWNPDGPRDYESGWRALAQLFCTNRRPVKKLLDIWPPLPIYIYAYHRARKSPLRGVTNIVAALKQQDRVFAINIEGVSDSLLKRIGAIKSLPALEQLGLFSSREMAPVLPDSFLGGSAPRLRGFSLSGIQFPGLKKLLLSTTDLVSLSLTNIPYSGYISPKTVVASLSTLTRLEQLALEFQSPRPRADRENRHPPPLPHIVLPALTRIQFEGDSEYLEDTLSRIDAPRCGILYIIFFNQLVFDTPHLRHFIRRTEQLKAADHASIRFNDKCVTVSLSSRLWLVIMCKPSDWQLSSLAQLYNSALSPDSPLPTLKTLEIHNYRTYWQDDMENIQWLELLHLFPSLKDIVISEKTFRLVAPSLDELNGDSVTEVLPALQNIFLQGRQSSEPDKKAIGRFVATRQLFGCPVAVQHRYDRDLDDN